MHIMSYFYETKRPGLTRSKSELWNRILHPQLNVYSRIFHSPVGTTESCSPVGTSYMYVCVCVCVVRGLCQNE